MSDSSPICLIATWLVLLGTSSLMMLAGCRTTDTQADAGDSWRESVEGLLASGIEYSPEYSPDSTWVLIQSALAKTAANPSPTVRLIVAERQTGRVTVDRSPGAGQASWYDSTHVRFIPVAGIVREGAPPRGFLLDARTGERKSIPVDL